MTSPLEPLNAAQRWQALVSQFNAALAIEQDLQRRVYECRFDLMRETTSKEISSIQGERQVLNQQLCEYLDELEIINDALSTTQVANSALELEESKHKQELSKIKELHNKLVHQEQNVADKLRSSRQNMIDELDMLDKEKKELRDNIKDLQAFIGLNKKLETLDIDQQAPVITIQKNKNKK